MNIWYEDVNYLNVLMVLSGCQFGFVLCADEVGVLKKKGLISVKT